jgi:hypothetical protein
MILKHKIPFFILAASFILCFIPDYSHAENISVTISGPGEGLVNEELSYSVDTKEEWVIESADWEFGDGSSSSGISVSHAYSNIGTNTVRVTVEASKEITNEDGSIDHEYETQPDTEKVTVRGKLSISADPKELPADGESTSTISVSTLDANDNPFNYKGEISLNLSESGDSNDSNDLPSLPNLRYLPSIGTSGGENNTSSSDVLSLGPLEIKDGSRTATATAGAAAGTAKIKAKGSYLSSASCTIKVKESKDHKLSISASPDILPADGKSQTTLTVKVLDEEGHLDTTYNGSVKLKSSNKSSLSVPPKIKISEGKGAVACKAGEQPAKVKITGQANNIAENSCRVDIFAIEIFAVNQNKPSLTRVYYHVKPDGVKIDKTKLYVSDPGSSSFSLKDSDSNVSGNCYLMFNEYPLLNKEGEMCVKVVGFADESSYSHKVNGENIAVESSGKKRMTIFDVVPSPQGYQYEKMGCCNFTYYVYCNKLVWQTYSPSVIRDLYKICESQRVDKTITTIEGEVADRLIAIDKIEVKNNGSLLASFSGIHMWGHMLGWDINMQPNLKPYKDLNSKYSVSYYHIWGYDYYIISHVGLRIGTDSNCDYELGVK